MTFDFRANWKDQETSDYTVLYTFAQLAKAWDLTREEKRALLGTEETIYRISYLLRIHAYLCHLLPQREAAIGWIKRPNTATILKGEPTALAFMTRQGKIDDIELISRYLMYQCT